MVFGGTLFVLILNKGIKIIFIRRKEMDEMSFLLFEIHFLKGNTKLSGCVIHYYQLLYISG